MKARFADAKALIRSALTGLALAVSPAAAVDGHAEEALKVGSTVSQRLLLGGKELPLPEGPWLVAADAVSAWSERDLGLLISGVGVYGYIRTVVLLRVADGRVD